MTDYVNPFRNPVGEVFARIVEKPEFAEAVRNDPEGTLAPFDLSDEDRESLIADAEALDSDVEGFASLAGGSPQFLNFIGGLRTPGRLGFQPTTHQWSGCLTCV